VSLSVAPGSIYGLIGPNGAGKTTFFNCVTGFYEPTSGELWLDGRRIDGLQQHEMSALGISRTFQNIRLFSNMTAVENVLVGGHAHHGIAANAPPPVRPSGRRIVDIIHHIPSVPRVAATAAAEVASVVVRPPRVSRAEREAIESARRLLAAVGSPAGRTSSPAPPYGDQRRLELAARSPPAHALSRRAQPA
jgi:branched-chain amino acid transport system ATP-binding protein